MESAQGNLLNINSSKVLIVDDNPDNIKLIGSVLKENGFDISVATDGESALKYPNLGEIDLILLDILMPMTDGFEICKKLKSDPMSREIPVIFLTALTETKYLVKGFQFGGVDYITKPFNSSELIARVTTHIELKKSKDLILKQKNELENLNNLKNKFFSIMSHDIRSPLTSILTFAEYLQSGAEDFSKEELVEYMEQFSDTIQNLYKLIENLIVWSNLQLNRIEMVLKPIPIKLLTDGIMEEAAPIASRKNIKLVNRIESSTRVQADENMLKFILKNLIDNALKFSNSFGEVTVFTGQKNGFLELLVQDQGVGMSESRLEKLFRVDVLSSSSGTSHEKGTGLGLIICKEFIQKMGGEINIVSKENSGTTCSFILNNA